jgi:prepilin-type N-terminal cleavage/methylation domain-containing protein
LRPAASRVSGVTLVELVMAMVILAILATAVVLSYKPTPVKARYQAERLRMDLSHAQMIALTENQALRVTVTGGAGGSYSVSTVSAGSATCTTAALTDPATNVSFAVTVDSAVTLGGTASMDIDQLGRPATCSVIAGICTCSTTAADPAATYTVAGGGTTYTVTIKALSGFGTITP